MRWAVAFGLLAACFKPTPPEGLACGPGLTCPAGQTCDLVSNECGPPSEALFFRDNTAAELATGTGDATIERAGFLSPAAYVTGAVQVSGFDGALTDLPFDTLIAEHPRTGVGLERSLHIHYAALSPPGLGIADPDNATVVIEGEIELEAAGPWRFQLTANDRGYLEIAAPGTTSFQRIADDVDSGTIGSFTVTEPGWHPFRAAFQDVAQFLEYDLVYDPPNVNGMAFRDIPTDRLRARGSELPDGLIVDGFERTNLIQLRSTRIDSTPLQALALGTDPLGLPVGTGYSMRWTGQLLVDVAGDYTFALASPNGHRLWLDGAALVDQLGNGTETITAPATLAAGWHDVVIDINKFGVDGAMSFGIDSGPTTSGPIPADHLRPISGRRARFVSDAATTAVALPDGTAVTGVRTLNFDLPASVRAPLDLRAAIDLSGADLTTVGPVVIDPPAGASITVAELGDLTGTSQFLHVPLDVANLGPFWQFIATDAVADMKVHQITAGFITLVYDGGIAPFATTSHHESAVKDLGDAVAFERIAWAVRGDPSAIQVSLRTCETEDCAGEAYVPVTNDTVPDLPPRRFAQYRVEIASDGDSSPALDAIELRYFVRGMD